MTKATKMWRWRWIATTMMSNGQSRLLPVVRTKLGHDLLGTKMSANNDFVAVLTSRDSSARGHLYRNPQPNRAAD
jgi:hypothetical protein